MSAVIDAPVQDRACKEVLHLMRLLPDLPALARWVAATGQRALREDTGYALHAALRATLGEGAPKPFALVERPGSVQLLGYTGQAVAVLQRAIDDALVTDPLAAQAVGLTRSGEVILKPMPLDWRVGDRLSFEVRVAPVLRSRAQPGGGYPELDAAFHAEFAGEDFGNRATVHARWLQRELARGGAATVLSQRPVSFRLAPMARRTARPAGGEGGGWLGRSTRPGLLPDLTVRGQLRIDDPAAFQAVLARGLGRHRSFGFGCLLLAPPGAWT